MTVPTATQRPLRCAIYTRKSSDEGLEQAFNSLHAQRAACEAYVLSQAGEGWICLPDAYDDGGISGATMERPGLQRLLQDVRDRKVEVVVVYKVDRLSRSLGDFARIVEVFDAVGASFVSVTQAFNTTSSMGRLTLNVLLSFAQFEREVTGERIRDKIALSKAKGMWMGGSAPLGYDACDQRLVINFAEAEQVRSLFQRYLEVGSVHLLCDALAKEGVRSKAWVTKAGRTVGGVVMRRGAVYHLLTNRHYLGEIVHKDQTYPGLHPPIVDRQLFDNVQASLQANRVERRRRVVVPAQAWLTGKVFDGEGRGFTPTFSTGASGRIHRYYVRGDLQVGKKPASERVGAVRRVTADALEHLVLQALRRYADRPGADIGNLGPMLIRLELRPAETQFVLDADLLFGSDHPALAIAELRRRLQDGEHLAEEIGERRVRIALARRMQMRGGRSFAVEPPSRSPQVDPILLSALRRAHRLAESHKGGGSANSRYERKLNRLVFLAPDLQRAIAQGRQPAWLSLADLLRSDIPLDWEEQRAWVAHLAQG